MTLPLFLLLLVALASAITVTVRQKVSPLSLGLWLWVGIALLEMVAPIPLTPVTMTGSIIIGVGLLALAIPSLWTRMTRPVVTQGHGGVAFARVVILTIAVGVMVVIGLLAFRDQIQEATGQGFSDLTSQQIRSAQTGDARGGGLPALFGALNPLLACLGVYGVLRYSRGWWLVVALALGASLQSTARLSILTLIVQVTVFYVLMRSHLQRQPPLRPPARKRRTPKRSHVVVPIVLGAILCAIIFSTVGASLGKNQLTATYFPNYPWPAWSLSPVMYFIGGPSALSSAVNWGIDPFDHPNSIYSLIRAASTLFPDMHVPNTLALPTPIGIGFNVYTGFGQIYFDFGFVGVVVLVVLLGWLASVSFARGRAGQVEWAWVASVLAGLLLSLPQAYRLFFLDVDFQLIIGFAVFWFVRRSRLTNRIDDAIDLRTSRYRYGTAQTTRTRVK